MISSLPDIKTLTINPETDPFMVLACDGIWNSMTSQEVIEFVHERLTKDPEQKLSAICEEVRTFFSCNLICVLILFIYLFINDHFF